MLQLPVDWNYNSPWHLVFSYDCFFLPKDEPKWGVLRDDYMLGSQTMKDWDRNGSGSEENSTEPDEIDEGLTSDDD